MRNKAALTFIVVLSIVVFNGNSQTTDSVKNSIRRIFESVLKATDYRMVDLKTTNIYVSFEEIPDTCIVRLSSEYNDWQYQNSLICFGMSSISKMFDIPELMNYSTRNVAFFADNYQFFEKQRAKNIQITPFPYYFEMKELWHCGLAANVADEFILTQDKRLLPVMGRFENHLFNVQSRIADGTLIRIDQGKKVVQSDDTYMAIAYLVRKWKICGDPKYLNEAIHQAKRYQEYLFDKKAKLYHHVWYCDENRSGGQYWGRGNGWMILSLVELLDFMPENHPARKEILSYYKSFIKSIAGLQLEEGLWPQVLNVSTAFPETSCSAMFIYAIAKGINKGWISLKYSSVAIKGWNGLQKYITPHNKIAGVCVATHYNDDLNYYLNRPTIDSDRHVLGSFLLAGAEVYQLLK